MCSQHWQCKARRGGPELGKSLKRLPTALRVRRHMAPVPKLGGFVSLCFHLCTHHWEKTGRTAEPESAVWALSYGNLEGETVRRTALETEH